MTEQDDRERLRETARALQELTRELVFVGGGVTSLLITDTAATPPRFSNDVDAIVRTARPGYAAIEDRLRQLGFSQQPDAPVCRWFKGTLILDVMPDDASVLGFSNRWYAGAIDHADTLDLDGVTVRVVSPPWFLGTKLEAFAGRGNGDFFASRDIEDIIVLIDGREELGREVRACPEALNEYIRAELRRFLESNAFVASVVGHLAGDNERAWLVLERVRTIAAGRED